MLCATPEACPCGAGTSGRSGPEAKAEAIIPPTGRHRAVQQLLECVCGPPATAILCTCSLVHFSALKLPASHAHMRWRLPSAPLTHELSWHQDCCLSAMHQAPPVLLASPLRLGQTCSLCPPPGIHPSIATAACCLPAAGDGSTCADSSLTEAQAALEDVCSPLQSVWWLDTEQPSVLATSDDSPAGSPRRHGQQDLLHQFRPHQREHQGRQHQLVHSRQQCWHLMWSYAEGHAPVQQRRPEAAASMLASVGSCDEQCRKGCTDGQVQGCWKLISTSWGRCLVHCGTQCSSMQAAQHDTCPWVGSCAPQCRGASRLPCSACCRGDASSLCCSRSPSAGTPTLPQPQPQPCGGYHPKPPHNLSAELSQASLSASRPGARPYRQQPRAACALSFSAPSAGHRPACHPACPPCTVG